MSRLFVTLALIAAASPQAQCAPPKCTTAACAWAWASATPESESRAAAALAWASVPNCDCKGTSPDCPCGPNAPTAKAKCAKCGTACQCGDCVCDANPDKLLWRAGLTGTIHLVKPGRCYGTHCDPEQVVGGYRRDDKSYRPFDGKAWGAVTKPPIAPPK